MNFKLVKLNCKNVGAYGVTGLSTGDVFQLEGRAAEKAGNNPDFKFIKAKKKSSKKSKS